MLILIALAKPSLHASQDNDEYVICGKKWYCEMTKDAEGNVIPPETGSEKDYMYFKCDSTFTLAEGNILLEGKWSFNFDTKVITLHQEQLNNFPESLSFNIIDADDGHMVIVAQSGTEKQETAYLVARP
ncbi:MAG: hypothetical protein KF744_17395 [Taibaiella sp.]|nr:hypothetical protein [Taibaiella sp.]